MKILAKAFDFFRNCFEINKINKSSSISKLMDYLKNDISFTKTMKTEIVEKTSVSSSDVFYLSNVENCFIGVICNLKSCGFM